MCIALIGGMDRLGRCYLMEAERVGISLKVFNGPEARLTSRMGKVDGMVIFTNKVSHRARLQAPGIRDLGGRVVAARRRHRQGDRRRDEGYCTGCDSSGKCE